MSCGSYPVYLAMAGKSAPAMRSHPLQRKAARRGAWRNAGGGLAHRALADGHGDEVGVVGALQADQHVVFAVGLRFRARLAKIVDVGDALAADIENDIAGLDAVLGGWTVRID